MPPVMANVCVSGAAGLQDTEPAWDAVIEHVPPVTNTMTPAGVTVQMPAEFDA